VCDDALKTLEDARQKHAEEVEVTRKLKQELAAEKTKNASNNQPSWWGIAANDEGDNATVAVSPPEA
jgi:hypothetical protein